MEAAVVARGVRAAFLGGIGASVLLPGAASWDFVCGSFFIGMSVETARAAVVVATAAAPWGLAVVTGGGGAFSAAISAVMPACVPVLKLPLFS